MGKVELHIEVDAALAARAEAHGVMLDAALEEGIKAALARQPPTQGMEEAARQWSDENAEAIASHRKFIEAFGAFGDDLRTW